MNREQEKRERVTVIHKPLNKHSYVATGGAAHNIKHIILSHRLAECCCSMLKIKTDATFVNFLLCHNLDYSAYFVRLITTKN